jgi:hypothetical protein
MKKASRNLLLAFCVAAAATAHAAPDRRAAQIERDVLSDVENGDCASAVKRLNEGLAEDHPQLNLLAATMFDHGVCVKRDWKRAVGLYVKADQGGEHAAAFRLAAGYAAPDRDPDIAAALWWLAHTSPLVQVKGCEVPPGSADDPDRFVAQIKSWPDQKLKACNYATGLVATIGGEVHYPTRALSHAMGGDFVLRFTPGLGRIDVQSGKTEEYQLLGIHSGDFVHERNTKYVTGTFEENLKRVAQRALERYPRPEGIDPSWQFFLKFRFALKRD